MPFIKLYVHAVWGTKHRYPLLDQEGRELLCNHILNNARKWNIGVININGSLDHLHVLLRMRSDMSIAQLIKVIKGEASRWANKKKLFEKDLYWARGYYARSIDENNIPVVRSYIARQNTVLLYHDEIVTFLNYHPTE